MQFFRNRPDLIASLLSTLDENLLGDKAELWDIKGRTTLVEFEGVIPSRLEHALETFSIGFLEAFKKLIELRLVVLYAATV